MPYPPLPPGLPPSMPPEPPITPTTACCSNRCCEYLSNSYEKQYEERHVSSRQDMVRAVSDQLVYISATLKEAIEQQMDTQSVACQTEPVNLSSSEAKTVEPGQTTQSAEHTAQQQQQQQQQQDCIANHWQIASISAASSVAADRNLNNASFIDMTGGLLASNSMAIIPQQQFLHYDDTTGSIYDEQLGAYYYPEHRLYYDPRFNAYYVFDDSTRAFIFHSQPGSYGRGPVVSDLDGSNYELVRSAEDVRRLSALRNDSNDVSAYYPPCLRLILIKPGQGCSNRRGQLFIIPGCTETSALIGTSKDADIQIIVDEDAQTNNNGEQPMKIRAIHARISYFNDEFAVQSCLIDGGGVCVDGRDVGQSAMPLSHDCVMLVGTVEFLVHQHIGGNTCARCEPSFYAVPVKDHQVQPAVSTAMAIKRRYGLVGTGLKPSGFSSSDKRLHNVPAYKDRAKLRRALHDDAETATANMKTCKRTGCRRTAVKMGWRVAQTDSKTHAPSVDGSGSH